MKTINTAISVIVIVIVAYFALRYLSTAAQAFQSQQAIGAARGGSIGKTGNSGGSLGQMLSSLFGKGNGNLLSDSQFQADLATLLDQSNQQVDSALNDVFIPQQPIQPFDVSTLSFPLNFDLTGGGGGPDTSMLQTTYDDSSWTVS